MMYADIAANLDEVMQVRGCPLNEDELWAILRKLITILHEATEKKYTISPKLILFLPNGELHIIQKEVSFANSSQISSSACSNYDHSFVKDVAMVVLWCAAYNLDEVCPLDISDSLQSLLTSMCERRDICTLDYVREICNHQLNAKPCDDSKIISLLCASILGDMQDLQINKLDINNSGKSSAIYDCNTSSSSSQDSLSFSVSSLSSENKPSCIENKQVKSLINSAPSNDEEAVANNAKKSNSNNNLDGQKGAINTLLCSETPDSVLKIDGNIQTLHIDFQSSGEKITAFYLEFMNHRKIEIITRSPHSTTVLDILQSSLNVFLQSDNSIDLNQLIHFGLAAWKDSYFYFFDNATTLEKILDEFSFQNTYYIRLLYFPFHTSSLSPLLITAMYIQVRADVMDERILCSLDEALGLTSLALQSELGDYKSDYGSNYVTIDEFLPHCLVSGHEISFIQNQLVSLHRQLAGIGEREAKLLYLRKSQKLNDYGVNFFRVYRLKSCKEKHLTWIGVGPNGVTNFDVKANSVRIPRHNLLWTDLKKISFKNRKIALTKLKPEFKIKFFQPDQTSAKYVVTCIGKLHKYYSSHPPTDEMTALSLFDDITGLSGSVKKSPFAPSPHSSFSPSSRTPRDQEKPKNQSWTYNTPQFRRNSKVVRKPSASSNATLHSTANAKSKAQCAVTQSPRTPRQKELILSSTPSTKQLVLSELQEILKEEVASLNSSGSASNHADDPRTEEALPTPMERKKRKAKLAAARNHPASTNKYSVNVNDVIDDDIHATARSFYQSSLKDDYVIPPIVEELNSTLLKAVNTELTNLFVQNEIDFDQMFQTFLGYRKQNIEIEKFRTILQDQTVISNCFA